jgi:hypothetical protein
MKDYSTQNVGVFLRIIFVVCNVLPLRVCCMKYSNNDISLGAVYF